MKKLNYVIRGEINCIKLKQWETAEKKYKAFIKLGVSEENAYKIAHSSRGLYYVSESNIVNTQYLMLN